MKLEKGTQIVYIPEHLKEKIRDNFLPVGVEYGFVTSVEGDHCFCRYWKDYKTRQLRTLANSERTANSCLFTHSVVPQEIITGFLHMLGYE